MIGDDGSSALHHRNPVGVGRGGHQHGTVDKLVDVLDVLNETNLARNDSVTDRDTGTQGSSLALDLVTAKGCIGATRLNSLRTRLDNENLAALAVPSPFHI